MADIFDFGIGRARPRRQAAAVLGASIFGVCMIIAVPASARVIDVPAQTTAAPVQPVAATPNNDAQMQVMQQKLEAIQNELSQMTSGLVNQSGSNAGLPLHGFMDVGYTLNSQGNNVTANPNVPNPRGFYEGRLSFYMAPQFSDRVRALAEPNFEVDQLDGTVGVDIERLQLGYAFSDAATLWAGRFHTPYGYWNTAFHHGAQIQTSIFRPRFLDFEDSGGILPAHTVGLWGTGKVRAGRGKFTYDWYLGNGPRIAGAQPVINPVVNPSDYQTGGLDPNIFGDDNHNALAGFNLGYEFPGMLDGLKLAVHMLNGKVSAYSDFPTTQFSSTWLNTTDLNVGGGSLVYLSNDWEIMSEYYGFNDKNMEDDSKHKSRAGYAQVGVNFDEVTPYIRMERVILDQADNYFSMQANGQSYARQVLGLRYNLSQKACMKFEMMNSNFMQELGRTALSYRSLNVQYAIRF